MPKRGLREETNRKKADFFLFRICFFVEFLVSNTKCVDCVCGYIVVIYMEYGSCQSYIVQYVAHSYGFYLANQIILVNIWRSETHGLFPTGFVSLLYSFILKLICLSLGCVYASCNTNARSFL